MNKGSRQIMAAVIAAITAQISFVRGEYVYTPIFGTPIVNGGQLIFSEAEGLPNRIIAIARNDGTKLWEIKDTNVVVAPWLVLDGAVIATKGSEIIACDAMGRTRMLYDTQYERCRLIPFGPGTVLASGVKGVTEYLSRIALGEAETGLGSSRHSLCRCARG